MDLFGVTASGRFHSTKWIRKKGGLVWKSGRTWHFKFVKHKKHRPNKRTQTRWPFSRGKFADLEAEEVGGSGEEEDEGFDEDRDHVRTSIYSTLSDSKNNLSIGLSPVPVTVTTRIITFLVGDPYKPSFATVTGRGDNPTYQLVLFSAGKNCL